MLLVLSSSSVAINTIANGTLTVQSYVIPLVYRMYVRTPSFNSIMHIRVLLSPAPVLVDQYLRLYFSEGMRLYYHGTCGIDRACRMLDLIWHTICHTPNSVQLMLYDALYRAIVEHASEV